MCMNDQKTNLTLFTFLLLHTSAYMTIYSSFWCSKKSVLSTPEGTRIDVVNYCKLLGLVRICVLSNFKACLSRMYVHPICDSCKEFAWYMYNLDSFAKAFQSVTVINTLNNGSHYALVLSQEHIWSSANVQKSLPSSHDKVNHWWLLP